MGTGVQGQWAEGGARSPGGLRAPGSISGAAGTCNIHTQLTVVISDGPWVGGENWSSDLNLKHLWSKELLAWQPEKICLGAGLREWPAIFLTDEEYENLKAK